MSVAEWLHQHYGFDRRIRLLSGHLVKLLPERASVLDVGCGDGTLDARLESQRKDLAIQGIDVRVRPKAKIPVRAFDGFVIPYADDSFDCVLFVDVLHHSQDAEQLLAEAKRVARQFIIIKDHLREGWFAQETLRFMDDVGNKRFGVDLPYNYWSQQEWRKSFRELGLEIRQWNQVLGLYPWPASLLFDRGLHFVAQLGAKPTNP